MVVVSNNNDYDYMLIIIICFGWCGLSVSVSVHGPCSFESNICLSMTMQMHCGGNDDDDVQESHHSQVNYCKFFSDNVCLISAG